MHGRVTVCVQVVIRAADEAACRSVLGVVTRRLGGTLTGVALSGHRPGRYAATIWVGRPYPVAGHADGDRGEPAADAMGREPSTRVGAAAIRRTLVRLGARPEMVDVLCGDDEQFVVVDDPVVVSGLVLNAEWLMLEAFPERPVDAAEVEALVGEGWLSRGEAADLSEHLAEWFAIRSVLWVDLLGVDLPDARRQVEDLAAMLAPNRDWGIGYLERLDHRTVRVGLDLGAYDGKPADAVRLAIDRTGLSGWTELFEGDERVFATWTPKPVPQRGIGRMELIAGPAHLVGWSAVD